MEQGQIKANGVNLHYTLSGDGPNVVLCIPGSLMPSELVYKQQLKYFGEKGAGFTIVAVDLRGFGKSERVDRFNADTCYGIDATDVHSLMKALGYTEYSVMGWCYGGGVAMTMAAMFPEAVKKLILLGTNSFYNEEDIKNLEYSRDSSVWPPYVHEGLSDFYTVNMIQKLWSRTIDVCQDIYKRKDGDICEEAISKITCPTLIVQGGKDEVVSPSHAPYLSEHIKGSQLLLIEDGKHWMHGQHSKFLEEVQRAMKTFLGA